MKVFITIAQAADILGCHPQTVRRLISVGKLPAFRLGPRAVRLQRDDVLAILQPIPTRGPK